MPKITVLKYLAIKRCILDRRQREAGVDPSVECVNGCQEQAGSPPAVPLRSIDSPILHLSGGLQRPRRICSQCRYGQLCHAQSWFQGS